MNEDQHMSKKIALAIVIIFAIDCHTQISALSDSQLAERISNFDNLRTGFMERESASQFGGNMPLSATELAANVRLMALKFAEYDEGFRHPKSFKPAHHFFAVHEQIAQTPLFAMLKTMPKGGILHVHDMALCSTDYLIELTYRDDLWVCMSAQGWFERTRFSRHAPASANVTLCEWVLLKELRSLEGAAAIDERLRARLTLYPHERFTDANDVWKLFGGIFGFLFGLVTFEPVWVDLNYRALEEFYADGVQYLEIRSILPILYDVDGTNFTIVDTVRVMRNASIYFTQEHPDFIGSMVIYAPNRNASDSGFREYIANALELKENFPDFFAGFDLVSHEDTGRPLRDFLPALLEVQNEIDFYFHAGETNWYGTRSDENLIDAILLGTKRIGHGYALPKHPEVMQFIKEQNVAIEVNPISNQILQHLVDFRNHPAAYLLAGDYPVVLASDDPSFWKATPATHDFYIAFLGIASRTAHMGMLKQLALNSIRHSAMDEERRALAVEKWQRRWSLWIEKIANASVLNN